MNFPLPSNEAARIKALNQYEILDTCAEAAYDDLTRLAAYICGTPTALISLVDTNRQWFKSKVGLQTSEISRDGNFCAYAILQRHLFIVQDTYQDARFCNNPLVTSDPKIRFYAGVPLMTPEDLALGTLCVIDYVPRELSAAQQEALRILARQVMTQLEERRNLAALEEAIMQRQQKEAALRELRHAALHDQLTGLPNRDLFMNRLKQALEMTKQQENYLFAVLFLDLDRFKVINDSLGHLLGDRCLCTIAHRLKNCLRLTDIAARIGGDEFTILLEGIEDTSDALHIANQIQQAVSLPFHLDGQEVFTTVSIGIALSTTSYDQAEDLLRDADRAMYHAKSKGKARSEVFNPEMYTQAEGMQLEKPKG